MTNKRKHVSSNNKKKSSKKSKLKKTDIVEEIDKLVKKEESSGYKHVPKNHMSLYENIEKSDYLEWPRKTKILLETIKDKAFNKKDAERLLKRYDNYALHLKETMEAVSRKNTVVGWGLSFFNSGLPFQKYSKNDLNKYMGLLFQKMLKIRQEINSKFIKFDVDTDDKEDIISVFGVADTLIEKRKKDGHLKSKDDIDNLIEKVIDESIHIYDHFDQLKDPKKDNLKTLKQFALVPYYRFTLTQWTKQMYKYYDNIDHLPVGLTKRELVNRVYKRFNDLKGSVPLSVLVGEQIEELYEYSEVVEKLGNGDPLKTVLKMANVPKSAIEAFMKNEQLRQKGLSLLESVSRKLILKGFSKALTVKKPEDPDKKRFTIIDDDDDDPVNNKNKKEEKDTKSDIIATLAVMGGFLGNMLESPTAKRTVIGLLNTIGSDASAQLAHQIDQLIAVGGDIDAIGQGALQIGGGLVTHSLTAVYTLLNSFNAMSFLAGAAITATASTLIYQLQKNVQEQIIDPMKTMKTKGYDFYKEFMKLIRETQGFTYKTHPELVYELGLTHLQQSLEIDAPKHIANNVKQILKKNPELKDAVGESLNKAKMYLEGTSETTIHHGFIPMAQLSELTLKMGRCFTHGKCVKGQDTLQYFKAFVDFVKNYFQDLETYKKNFEDWKRKYTTVNKLIEPPPPPPPLPSPTTPPEIPESPPPPPPPPSPTTPPEIPEPIPEPTPEIPEPIPEPTPEIPEPTPTTPHRELPYWYKIMISNNYPIFGQNSNSNMTFPPSSKPTPAPTHTPTPTTNRLLRFVGFFEGLGKCLGIRPPTDLSDKADVGRFFDEAQIKALESAKNHHLLEALTDAGLAWATGQVALPYIIGRLVTAGVASLVKGVWVCSNNEIPEPPKMVHPHCPPNGIPRGQPGSAACPPLSGGLLPGSRQKEIDPYAENTVLSGDLKVPEEQDIKATLGQGQIDPSKGTFNTQPVQPVTGDKDLRLVSNSTELDAINEQRMRESLTALGLLDLLSLNQQNRPLPDQLRQSRTIYYGGAQSGFSDPLTNPFSKFVWHAKDDRYYVKPTDSVNSFRRQVWRQKMINLGLDVVRQYPEAS